MVEKETIQVGDVRLVEVADEKCEGDGKGIKDGEKNVSERRAEVAGEFAT